VSIKRFEDLIAWQYSRKVVQEIYQLTNNKTFRTDFALKDQIRRAAISIMANIAEGFHRWNRKDFHHFLQIAIASVCETKSHLYVALDMKYANPSQFDQISANIDELIRIITGFMKSLRAKEE
jgi:four helix bundle protein